MHIEINPGEGVTHSAALDGQVRKKLGPLERHHGDRLTRVEVFLKDTNARKGGVDKSCTMEARPAGFAPIAVEALDADIYKAVHAAAEKLEKALEHRLGRAGVRR